MATSKKTVGRYNIAAAQKALKAGSGINSRLFCQVLEDGPEVAAVCNGYILFRVTAPEYDAIIRPLAGRDPGNWTITGDRIEENGTDFNKLLTEAAREVMKEDYQLQACPVLLPSGKGYLTGYYNKKNGCAPAFNSAYIDALAPGFDFFSKAETSGAVAAVGGTPFAFILPVRVAGSFRRMVAAYCSEDPNTEAEKQVNEARREVQELREELKKAEMDRNNQKAYIDQLQAARSGAAEGSGAAEKIQELEQTIAAKNEQIEAIQFRAQAAEDLAELRAKKIEKQAAEKQALIEETEKLRAKVRELENRPAAPARSAAAAEYSAELQAVVDKFKAIAGAVVTVKGAGSSCPVIWISGGDAAEVQAAGGKWSNKRGAYWCGVA